MRPPGVSSSSFHSFHGKIWSDAPRPPSAWNGGPAGLKHSKASTGRLEWRWSPFVVLVGKACAYAHCRQWGGRAGGGPAGCIRPSRASALSEHIGTYSQRSRFGPPLGSARNIFHKRISPGGRPLALCRRKQQFWSQHRPGNPKTNPPLRLFRGGGMVFCRKPIHPREKVASGIS